jgi:hypothetical protein
MRKLREAAVVAAVVGSASMIGAGAASAHGWEEHQEPPTSVSIECEQDTGDNTLTTQEAAAGVDALNLNNVGNGGDADASATQQICGLENEEVENEAGDATGGEGGDIGDILAP